MIDVDDLRRGDRFLVADPLFGSFGAVEIEVLNVAERGAQIEHAQPLRIGTRARLMFARGDVSVAAFAVVLWSRLSSKPDAHGKLLYRSGLRIPDPADGGYANALQTLAVRGAITFDADSLDRKRRRDAERNREKEAAARVKQR